MSVIYHINRTKEKNHVIILIDAGKAFDKIEHPLTIKALSLLGLEANFLNMKMIFRTNP